MAFDFKPRLGIDLKDLTIEQAEMLTKCFEEKELEGQNQFLGLVRAKRTA